MYLIAKKYENTHDIEKTELWGTNYWNSANVWVSRGVLGCLLSRYLATYHPSYFPIVFIQPNLLFCSFTKNQALRWYFVNIEEEHSSVCYCKGEGVHCVGVGHIYHISTKYWWLSTFFRDIAIAIDWGSLENINIDKRSHHLLNHFEENQNSTIE